ncbi:MAG TPA: tail fiber domain-containing protein, partial [Blastocatellia bacterium]|nr:tail fiber domain-containing protein [Blastocatellia bacterium]
PVTTGSYNSFFGYYSGNVNTTGAGNSFFGRYAGLGNTTGSYGTFVGSNSGSSNTTENNNTFIGAWTNGAAGLTNATAIGYRAAVSQSNSLVLGSINGENGATVSVNVGIGTTTPTQRLHVVGNGLFTGTLSGSIVSATTQYNLAGLRMLAASGPYNDGLVILAASNTFVGEDAGLNTTPDPTPSDDPGKFNSFFGAIAGRSNTTGSNNSFFGSRAGYSNTTGRDNSFFGYRAGLKNTTGYSNAFYGISTGYSNTTGDTNAFYGADAGYNNTTGNSNSFFGYRAGHSNTTGIDGIFIGEFAGNTNTTENHNTIIGASADLSAGVTNATALGYRASVTQSNSLVLGSINGVNFATADTRVGIGTTAPQTALHVKNSSYPTILGESSSAIGTWLRLLNGSAGGRTWSIISSGSGNGEGAGKLLFFDEAANATRMWIDTNGFVTINALGSAGETTLCLNASNQISTCSSSMRYKTNVAPFNQGLNLINQLRPISFNWREGGLHDLGLSAEEVAAIEPLLVTRNEKGEVEGVKYDRIAIVLINAIKQQQAQIESLKKLVCMDHPDADVCK